MNFGVLQSTPAEARRIVFENPRVETVPTDNPAVGEIPIFLRKELHQELLHGAGKSEATGGLIVGAYCIGNGVEFLEVEAIVTAPGASGVPFTLGAWETLLKGCLEQHVGALGLGWWLARGGGVNLSPSDRAFHEAFFPLPWQVALLVDPVAGTARFHQRSKGHIEECGYFLVQPRRN